MGNLREQQVRRVYRWLADSWSNRPAVDLLVVVVALSSHLVLVYGFGVYNLLGAAESGQRLTIYAAGAGMTSLVAGFAGTAIAVYASASGDLVSQLRTHFGRVVQVSWRSILGWLLTGAVLCLIAMTIDSKSSARSSEWIFEFALLIAVVKFVRLTFLFSLVMAFIDQDSASRIHRAPEWEPHDPGDSYRPQVGRNRRRAPASAKRSQAKRQ